MASNSSKTAHVMNLLSKNRGASAPAETTAETAAPESPAPVQEAVPAPEPAAPAAPVTPVAPILTSINADAAVSSQIKDALEAELAGEAAPAPEPAPAAEPEPAPVQEAAPAESSAPAAPAEPEAEAPAGDDDVDYTYVNVMQTLVDEKADKYMEMFGICCCKRCKADVRAYALNHLPPKYVYLGPQELIPRLTVYESKYSSDIVAQLINACKIVMNTPHHTR